MKKKLLFIIDSLGIGGAEKSLLTLLNQLDFSKYNVDLQLFGYGGSLVKFLPSEVNILPPLNLTKFLSKPIWLQLSSPLMLFARITYSFLIMRKDLLHSKKAILFWKNFGNYIENNPKIYDVAIAYAQGVPTFYCIDKVHAQKKLTWVNIDYRLVGKIRNYQSQFYGQCNMIVNVSEHVQKVFSEVYPEYLNKMHIIRDMINVPDIEIMSRLPLEKNLNLTFPVLMTVGRLEKNQKGYDLAIETAKVLSDRGVKFNWYAVGEGSFRFEMENLIKKYGLEERFILLGATPNPYNLMKQCDIYVQPSRHEGFGLTIAEALVLNKPVVCTNFEGCTMQMIHKKNGLITSFNPIDIANAIELLINDETLRSNMQEFIRSGEKGNLEELDKFYRLIES